MNAKELIYAIEQKNSQAVEQLLHEFAQEVAENVLRSLPSVVHSLVAHTARIKEMSDKFYQDNPKFEKNRQLVAKALEDTEAANPGVSYDKLLELAKPVAESRLRTLESTFAKQSAKPGLDQLDHLAGML